MLHLIADAAATQPATGFSNFTAADWCLIIAAIAAAAAAWRRAGKAKDTAHAADTKASAAVAGNDAAQASLDRFSARANATDSRVADLAHKMPPPPTEPK